MSWISGGTNTDITEKKFKNKKKYLSLEEDLKLRPSDLQSDALPTELRRVSY